MRRWYYTLLLPAALATAYFIFRWLQPRPIPSMVTDSAVLQWHLIDPNGILVSHLPIPTPAKPILRGVHLAGSLKGLAIVEAQTRLPGPLLRLWPVAGFVHGQGPWDLTLMQADGETPVKQIKIPPTEVSGSAVAWLPGAPPIQIALEGDNPFRFTSFCPGTAEEVMLAGPSEEATLFGAAGRSPHLARLMPGLRPVRIEAGPDWGDITVMDHGRRRSLRWGASAGSLGEPISLSLWLLYQRGKGGGPRWLKAFLPDGMPPETLLELEARCHAVERGERCEGHILLR